MKTARVILLTLVLLMMIGSASASVTWYVSPPFISVVNEGDITLSSVITKLNDSSKISKAGDIIYLNAEIRTTNSRVVITDADCKILDMGTSGKLYYTSKFLVHDVELRGGSEVGLGTGSQMYNTFLNNTGVTRFQTISNTEFYNITSEGKGLKFLGGTNNTVRDIAITNATNTGFQITAISVTGSASHYTVYNVSISHPTAHLSPTTDRYGFDIGDGTTSSYTVRDIDISNITIDGCAWSGLSITDSAYNVTGRDIYIKNAGHNGLDVHSTCPGVFIDNLTIVDSVSNGFFLTGAHRDSIYNNVSVIGTDIEDYSALFGYATVAVVMDSNNITVNDLYVRQYRKYGEGIKIGAPTGGERVGNTVSNFTIDNAGTGSYIYQQTAGYTNDTLLINGRILNCTTDFKILGNVNNARLVNVPVTVTDYISGKYMVLYPLNVKVQNPSGQAVENAQINITTTGISLNGLGTETITAYTDSTGKLNESQQLYVADFLRTETATYAYYTVDVSASKDGQTDSELSINPDSTWYSANINDLQGTEYVLVLDVDGTGEPELITPVESRDRMSGPETAIALIGVLLVVLVATAILGSLAGLITGVIDMQQTAAIVGAMVLVAVLAFVGLAVLSGISGALNL